MKMLSILMVITFAGCAEHKGAFIIIDCRGISEDECRKKIKKMKKDDDYSVSTIED